MNWYTLRVISGKEKKIKEVFTGIMTVQGKLLIEALKEIKNNNAASEYYLTDLVEILSSKGVKINCILSGSNIDLFLSLEQALKKHSILLFYALERINEIK